MKEIEKHAQQNVIKVLVGNKCDLPYRVVTHEEGKKLLEDFSMSFFETSSKSGLDVNEMFNHITKQIIYKLGLLEKVPIKKESIKKRQNVFLIYFLVIKKVKRKRSYLLIK